MLIEEYFTIILSCHFLQISIHCPKHVGNLSILFCSRIIDAIAERDFSYSACIEKCGSIYNDEIHMYYITLMIQYVQILKKKKFNFSSYVSV